MSDHLSRLSVLLLAGGRGQRMGERDKGLMHWHGRPMVAWIHDVVRPLTDDLIISCNRNHEHYLAYADRVFSDDQASFEGPLAGIRVGLRQARYTHILVLPCDAPQVDADLIQQLIQKIGPEPVVVRQGEWVEPLFCLLSKALSASLEEAWNAGERSAQRWFAQHSPTFISCQPGDPRLNNFNSPDSLSPVK